MNDLPLNRLAVLVHSLCMIGYIELVIHIEPHGTDLPLPQFWEYTHLDAYFSFHNISWGS